MCNMDKEKIYKELAEHLDNLPAGFPSTDSGIEFRILKRLFTPEEANIAKGLTFLPKDVKTIARRLDRPKKEVMPYLEKMARKGLIYSFNIGKKNFYFAAQFVIGIWENQVKKLDKELIKDVNEYMPYIIKSNIKLKTQQLRVIPVDIPLEPNNEVMPYEEAKSIIMNESKIVIAPCICREENRIMGTGCDKPVETCLTFGFAAEYYEKNGLGRDITHKDALEILAKGKDAGLVLQPGNAKKPFNICMCCSCCCQILKVLKQLDNPAKHVRTNHFARVDSDLCTGCGECVKICPMEAITINYNAKIIDKRCIGCGICVSSCSFNAIALMQKKGVERYTPPEDMFENFELLAMERGKI